VTDEEIVDLLETARQALEIACAPIEATDASGLLSMCGQFIAAFDAVMATRMKNL
jgi:hypothetical protein